MTPILRYHDRLWYCYVPGEFRKHGLGYCPRQAFDDWSKQ
jgi:hypothetical protein